MPASPTSTKSGASPDHSHTDGKSLRRRPKLAYAAQDAPSRVVAVPSSVSCLYLPYRGLHLARRHELQVLLIDQEPPGALGVEPSARIEPPAEGFSFLAVDMCGIDHISDETG